MNILDRLNMHYDGIKETIVQYSSKGHIYNFLQQLNMALNEKNLEKIKYLVNEICDWYSDNIYEIMNNRIVFNKKDHMKTKEMLEKFNEELKDFDSSQQIKTPVEDIAKQSPCVFLSHKSDDKKYGDALEKFITGLGIKNEQLVYTSHPLHKIPLGNDIFEYLKTKINKNVLVVILWSDVYLSSPACLAEMGATWIINAKHINIYTPNFNFNNSKYKECPLNTYKGIVLKNNSMCKSHIIDLKNDILSMFNLNIEEQQCTHIIDQFMEEIQSIKN